MRIKFPCVDFKEGENVWVSYAKHRVFKDNNCINLVVTGTPGSGKSWGLLSYFCLINPDFELSENWFFRARDLLRVLKEDRFKSGKIWGYDEAGIDANNLKYFDVVNQGLNALFQTARHHNYIFGLTLPFLSMLSKGVRTLMTSEFKAVGWNKRDLTVLYPKVLEYNGELDKFYKKRLIVRKDSELIYCDRILLPKPPKHIIVEYEKLKKEFTASLYNKVYDNIVAFDDKLLNKSKMLLLTDREEVILSHLKELKSVADVGLALGIKKTYIYEAMRNMSRKGVVIRGVRGLGNVVSHYDIKDSREVKVEVKKDDLSV